MCWFVIDPQTGEHLRQVEKPARGRERTLYLHNLALDGFFDTLWGFHAFLAHHPRPPFEDLVAFAVDGTIPESMMPLVGPDLSRFHQAMQDFWAGWDEGEEGYRAFLGRPMFREEKYWLIHSWLRRMAVGREQFYAGKAVRSEEWLVDWRAWDGRRWGPECWGRLRVFSDGTADAWYPGVGVLGYDNVDAARHELSQTGYHDWEELKARFPKKPWTAPPAPLVAQADDSAEPFRYEGG
jgi:hypothetical protein